MIELIIKAAIITGMIALFVWVVKAMTEFMYEKNAEVMAGVREAVREASPVRAIVFIVYSGLAMIIMVLVAMGLIILTAPLQACQFIYRMFSSYKR